MKNRFLLLTLLLFFVSVIQAQWVTKSPLSSTRSFHATVAHPNGNIYSFTGHNGSFLNSLEIYDPTGNSWSSGAACPVSADGVAYCLGSDNLIYEMGGFNGPILSSGSRYNPSTNSWASIASMTGPRWEAKATSFNGKIYVFGGVDASINPTNTLQIYDIASDSWSSGANMPMTVYEHGVARVGNYIYIFGGRTGGYPGTNSNDVLRYDIGANSYSNLGSLMSGDPKNSFGFSYAADGNIYLTGGSTNYDPAIVAAQKSTVNVFSPSSNTFLSNATALPAANATNTLVATAAGIYSMAGYTSTPQNTNYFLAVGTPRSVSVTLKNCAATSLAGGVLTTNDPFATVTPTGTGAWTVNTSMASLNFTLSLPLAGIQTITSSASTVNFVTTKVTLKLQTCAAVGIQGALMWGWSDSGDQPYGTTNASGIVEKEVLPGQFDWRAYLNGGHQDILNQTVSGCTYTYTFTSTTTTLKLQNCATTGIAGGQAYVKGLDSTYFVGTTNGSGTASVELLSGYVYHFRMEYNNGRQVDSNITISGCSYTRTFTTTAVSFQFANGNGIDYTGNIGGPSAFTSPKELLPGAYTFTFKKTSWANMNWNTNISGCSVTKSIAIARFRTSANAPIAGVPMEYFVSSWVSMGNTDANGQAIAVIDGLVPDIYVRVTYLGATEQKGPNNIASNSFINMNTILITMQLRNSADNADLGGTNAQFYSGGWQTFGSGTTPTTFEMLSQPYYFRVTYAQVSLNMYQDISTNPLVKFQTKLVTVNLRNEADNTNLPGTNAQYFNGTSWVTFGTGSTPTTMELLPMFYDFKLKYLNAEGLKTQDVGANPLAKFQTKLVTVKLRNYLDNADVAPTAGSVQYYNGTGWVTFGSGNNNAQMEILANDYYFRVSYLGFTQQKWQQTALNPIVKFQTTRVVMKLRTIADVELNGGAEYWNGASWVTFGSGTTETNQELLPLNYDFRVTRASVQQVKNQDVGVNNEVKFVTKNVTMKLLDGTNGNAEIAGVAEYHNGAAWVGFGGGTTTTSYEMLQRPYYFRCTYSGKTLGKYIDIVATPTVIFNWNGTDLSTVSNGGTAPIQNTQDQSSLGQNFPNPFAGVTTIPFHIANQGKVKIAVYDLMGREVSVLLNSDMQSGDYSTEWNSSELPAGNYFVRMEVMSENQQIVMTKTMVTIK